MKECRYVSGTVVRHDAAAPATSHEDDLLIRLDLPIDQDTFFGFDRLLIPDSPEFPFDIGDRIEVIIRTIEE